MGVTIKLRGDVAAAWAAANPVLKVREIGLELDTKKYKVGDGTSTWDQLEYWGELPAHSHDQQYYTEGEVDGLLAGKAAAAHNHDASYAAAAHTHNYAAVSHTHNYAAVSHAHSYNPLSDITLGTVVTRTGDLYMTSNVWTTIGFNGVHYERATWADWDGGTAIYPKKNGLYLLYASATFNMNGSNGDNLVLRFLRQGTDLGVYAQQRNGNNLTLQATFPFYLSLNQYVQVQALACCGGSPYLQTNSPKFGMIYIGHQ